MTLQTLLEGVHLAVADVKAIEPLYKEAQHNVYLQVEELKQSIGDDSSLQEQVIAHLYWFESYVLVASISDAFKIDQVQVRRIACQQYPDIRCLQCNSLLIDPENKRPRRSLLCTPCTIINRTSESAQEIETRVTKAKRVRKAKTQKAERDKAMVNHLDKKKTLEERDARIKELRAMPYVEYLQTSEWKNKRLKTLKRSGYHCQLCNKSDVMLNVHHRTYERLGCERIGDLITLCHDCHEKFHKNGKLVK
jgi:hypothetical protein